MLLLSFQCKHHFIDSLYYHIHFNSLCVNKLPAHIIFFPKSLCIFCFDDIANKCYNDVGLLYLFGWPICECEFNILIFNHLSLMES